MTPVEWTDPAKVDLARIDDELAALDTDYADRVGTAAIAAGRFLAEWPGAGPPVDEAASVHKWPVKHTPYVLVYSRLPDRVEILRVHHNHENWREENWRDEA